MGTGKTTRQSGTKLTASMAHFGSICRFNPDKFNAFSFSFVLDKTLQLEETPITNPIVHSPASPLFPYSLEVFHHNPVSVKLGNNLLADVVVYPLHPTVFSPRELLEKPFAGTSAFALEFASQIFEFSFDLLDFSGIKKLAVGSDCQVIDSDINAKNSVRTRAFDIKI